jgi:GNAT superfamily N-acetyltransferase
VTPDGLAALCDAALPGEALSADDLTTCCFEGGGQVIGDDDGAAAFVVKEVPGSSSSTAWLLLVAVRPERRRSGLGRALVNEVIEHCRAADAVELHTGNCAPRYVWPGVDLANAAALAFFQSMGFEPYDHGLNMLLPTSFRAPAPAGITIERERGDGAAALASHEYPHWEDEVGRGVDKGTTFAARDGDGRTVAFACHSVNRHAWIGPMATDPARQHCGAGRALLSAVAADLAGVTEQAEIAWVAPIPFYAKAGAVAGRAFRIHRLGLEGGR